MRSLTVTIQPESGPRRRIRFERREGESGGEGYWRIDEEWTGCRWRAEGREAVDDLDVAVDTRESAQSAGETLR